MKGILMEKDLVDTIIDELIDAKSKYKKIELEYRTTKQKYKLIEKQYYKLKLEYKKLLSGD